jgi:hypothetical protein
MEGRNYLMYRLWLSAAACLQATALTAGDSVSIPARLNATHQMFVSARINNSAPMSCSLDSGGGANLYLDQTLAATLGVKPTSEGRSASPNDSRMRTDQRAQTSIEVAGLKFENQPVVLRQMPMAEFACVIGLAVFRSYAVDIDYEQRVVRLLDSERLRYAGPGQLLSFSSEGNNVFLETSLILPGGDKVPARLAVDTGGGRFTVLLSKSFADRNRILDRGVPTEPDSSFGYENGQPKVVVARFSKLAMGRMELAQPAIHIWRVKGFGGGAEPDGLLCGGALRRFRLIIDYPKHHLFLEPNSQFGNP